MAQPRCGAPVAESYRNSWVPWPVQRRCGKAADDKLFTTSDICIFSISYSTNAALTDTRSLDLWFWKESNNEYYAPMLHLLTHFLDLWLWKERRSKGHGSICLELRREPMEKGEPKCSVLELGEGAIVMWSMGGCPCLGQQQDNQSYNWSMLAVSIEWQDEWSWLAHHVVVEMPNHSN